MDFRPDFANFRNFSGPYDGHTYSPPQKKHGNGRTDPAALKKTTDGHELHLGIPWPSLPMTVSRVRTFIDTLKQWAEEPWATTVDVPFVIRGCTERTVIFDLRFRMTVPDGDPVLLRDDVIGRRLRWEGVEEAIAPRERGAGRNEAPREPPRAPLHATHRGEDEADPRVAPGMPEASAVSPR